MIKVFSKFGHDTKLHAHISQGTGNYTKPLLLVESSFWPEVKSLAMGQEYNSVVSWLRL